MAKAQGMEARIRSEAVLAFGKTMGEIGRDSEMLLIISERCRDWAMSAQDGNERQTAAGMCTALRQAAYNVNDPERGPLVRFCTAMMGGFAK